jgi:hypothetical protein
VVPTRALAAGPYTLQLTGLRSGQGDIDLGSRDFHVTAAAR